MDERMRVSGDLEYVLTSWSSYVSTTKTTYTSEIGELCASGAERCVGVERRTYSDVRWSRLGKELL